MLNTLMCSVASAASLNEADETWGDLYGFMHGLFTGTPGNILSLVALALGIFGALASNHKMLSLLGAIGIPIAIQVGPEIFEHLSGAVL
mgnify:CR=1 FL=1